MTSSLLNVSVISIRPGAGRMSTLTPSPSGSNEVPQAVAGSALPGRVVMPRVVPSLTEEAFTPCVVGPLIVPPQVVTPFLQSTPSVTIANGSLVTDLADPPWAVRLYVPV